MLDATATCINNTLFQHWIVQLIDALKQNALNNKNAQANRVVKTINISLAYFLKCLMQINLNNEKSAFWTTQNKVISSE